MKLSRHWLWLLLVIPMAFGLWRLRLDVEVLNLLPDQFPVVRGIKLYQTNFSNGRELIITLNSEDPEAAENAARGIAQALRTATNLTRQVTWQPLWLENPGQSAELIAYAWFNQPPSVFGTLTNRLADANLPVLLRDAQEALTTSLSPVDLARRGYDPFGLTQLPETISGASALGEGQDFFVSADGTFRVVFVEARPVISDYRKCTRWLEEVNTLVTNALHSGQLMDTVKVRYTGRPAFTAEIAAGLKRDLAGPSGATLLVIAALFYLTHRRLKPLLWLTALLLMILGGTMALGGLLFGTLNIISLGFASILLGLAEDFGIVLYQESRSHPKLSVAAIRKMAAPGIFWSTVTTCGAFLVLNLAGLPGFGQLGTLVAIGIALAAVVMLYAYLPPLMRRRAHPLESDEGHHVPERAFRRVPLPWLSTVIVLFICAMALLSRHPIFDNSADALRPRNSPAYSAIAEIKQKLKRTQEPMWVLVTGRDEAGIAARLKTTEAALQQGVSNGWFTGFTLMTSVWPEPAHQSANRAMAASLAQKRNVMEKAVVKAGFTSQSFELSQNMLTAWRCASESGGVFWPTNESSRWMLDKFIARRADQAMTFGLIYLNTNMPLTQLTPRLLALGEQLAKDGIYVSGWEVLGYTVFAQVKKDFWKVMLPMTVLVLFTLWLAFRSVREVVLSITTLAVSGLCLLAFMGVAGWSWNLLNLMSLPLLLGMGVDFSIHIQLALQRHHGDLALVRGSIGRALLLAGSTTVAGFASLAFSSNAGMASLGKVCGMGIVCAMLVSVFLLPLWWQAWRKK
jgi:predicted RND superfamily exporter protein